MASSKYDNGTISEFVLLAHISLPIVISETNEQAEIYSLNFTVQGPP
jgi:hypothetical protein